MFSQHKTVRPGDHEYTDRQKRIHNFLSQNPVGVLSTVTPDGDPHGTVIYYTVDEHFSFFFLTKSETRKYDNLKRNGQVMLTVFESQSQSTVQIAGHATEVGDAYTVNAIAGTILATSMKTSEAGLPPISKLQAGSYVAFQIEPATIRMAIYARPDSGEYNDLFETIESFELRNT